MTAPDIDLRCGRWQDVLADVECDALIADPPYSGRTHDGHESASRRDASAMPDPDKATKPLGYSCWSASDVAEFAESWSPRVRGWFCVLTDHVLARSWEDELQARGRYVFSPIACVESGSRVRLTGDGPAQWSTWLVVSRPRNAEFQRWGSLPGAYLQGRETKLRMGGKGLKTMRAIVRDYSREGDLVCDPCAGGATTLLAARLEGRRAVGSEQDAAAYAQAMEVIANGYGRDPKQEVLL